tara:strand:+ start:32 stop:208 length:177 start_codon:yes stop_codon:yes gene_type:complete
MLRTMFCKIKKSLEEYREWQLKFYRRAEDTLEQRLAGIKAAKEKLEEQIQRDVPPVEE